MNIKIASIDDLTELSKLFDGYRIFYGQESDLAGCRVFIKERIEKEEAVIFIAYDSSGVGAGFTLLYPTFSSVSRQRIFVLNDLYVSKKHRRLGLGAQLMATARDYGKKHGAIRLHLETGIDNVNAQALYEKEGWIKETDTYHYNYTL